MSSFLIHLLTVAALYGVMALGLNFQAGYAGLVNFGFVAFVGVGAYAAGIVAHAGMPFGVGLLAAVAAASLLALLMSRLGRNLAADYWGIATLAFAEILRTVALNESEWTGGAQGIGGIGGPFAHWSGVSTEWAFLVVSLLCLALCLFASNRLSASRFGRALKVMREQPALAVCFGYDPVRLKTQASVVSAIPAALAGALLTYYMSFVGPDALLASETFLIWTIVMIGGLGNGAGVLLGAFVVQGVYSSVPFLKDALGIGSDLAGAMRLGIIGALLLCCLLWRPAGLLPEKIGGMR